MESNYSHNALHALMRHLSEMAKKLLGYVVHRFFNLLKKLLKNTENFMVESENFYHLWVLRYNFLKTLKPKELYLSGTIDLNLPSPLLSIS